MNWEILDCTLRDGGYYTQWDFDQRLVDEYVNAIRDLPISYIEVGYRNPAQKGYAGKYYYVSVPLLEQLISSGVSVSRLGVMLDVKLIRPSEVKLLLEPCQGRLGVVRLAVQPSEIDAGLDVAAEIKKLGFKVGVNLMYMHDEDNLMKALTVIKKRQNALDWVSLVDSFGACFPQQVSDAIHKFKSTLPHKIGFHGHDNLHLAFANTLAAISAGADIVDSTILGMGRGAGNLKTELILTYWNELSHDTLDLSSVGALLESFQKLQVHYGWGTSLPYMISGAEALPQKDVMKWIGMRRYSTPTILRKLRAEFSQAIDQRSVNTFQPLTNIEISESPCLILGGGETIAQHIAALRDFSTYKECIVIHSSLKNLEAFSNVSVRQFVCLPGDEYRYIERHHASELEGVEGFLVEIQFNGDIAALKGASKKIFRLTDQHLLPEKADLDVPLNMACNAARELSLSRKLYLAGFDGYANKNESEGRIEQETQRVIDDIQRDFSNGSLSSITPTRYRVNELSVYALLQSMSQSKD